MSVGGVLLIPLFLVVAQVGVNVRSHLEEGTGTARKEIAVYFPKGDTRVKVDMFFLDSRFLLYISTDMN